MKPTHSIPVTLFGALLSLSLGGIASPSHATTLVPPPIDSNTAPGPIENPNSLTSVDVELALILDSSTSVSPTDFKGILDAYYSIFTNQNFFKDFVSYLNYDGDKMPRIAVSVFQFGTDVVQNIPWTMISNQNEAQTFGNQFSSIEKMGGYTNMGGAIEMATQSLLNNNFAGKYSVFDISSDGRAYRSRPHAATAAQKALTDGINVINAIAIKQDPLSVFAGVVGGINPDGETAAFILEAGSIDKYEATLRQKLRQELQGTCPPNKPCRVSDPLGVPEPSSILGLLGIGLLALVSKIRSAKS